MFLLEDPRRALVEVSETASLLVLGSRGRGHLEHSTGRAVKRGKLSEEDWSLMRRHPDEGVRMLSATPDRTSPGVTSVRVRFNVPVDPASFTPEMIGGLSGPSGPPSSAVQPKPSATALVATAGTEGIARPLQSSGRAGGTSAYCPAASAGGAAIDRDAKALVSASQVAPERGAVPRAINP